MQREVSHAKKSQNKTKFTYPNSHTETTATGVAFKDKPRIRRASRSIVIHAIRLPGLPTRLQFNIRRRCHHCRRPPRVSCGAAGRVVFTGTALFANFAFFAFLSCIALAVTVFVEEGVRAPLPVVVVPGEGKEEGRMYKPILVMIQVPGETRNEERSNPKYVSVCYVTLANSTCNLYMVYISRTTHRTTRRNTQCCIILLGTTHCITRDITRHYIQW